MMALAVTGYSGKPLHAKLGLKDGMAAAFIALPETLEELSAAVKLRVCDRFANWAAIGPRDRVYDFVHAFSANRAEIENELSRLELAIVRDGMIWVSWPKQAARIASDVTEGVVRECALRLDLVDVKVAAVSEIWSGLKLVIRKDRR